MTPQVERLISEIRALPAEDCESLLQALLPNPPPGHDQPLTEDETADEAYQRHLLVAGLISEVRLRSRDPKLFEFTPVEITGEPLSQTIIEERR